MAARHKINTATIRCEHRIGDGKWAKVKEDFWFQRGNVHRGDYTFMAQANFKSKSHAKCQLFKLTFVFAEV